VDPLWVDLSMHWKGARSTESKAKVGAKRPCVRSHQIPGSNQCQKAADQKGHKISWRETVAKAAEDPKKMWQLAKWAHTTALEPPAPPQFPPLEDRQGQIHSTNDAKAELLANHFFSPSVPASLTNLKGHIYPPELPAP